ncbi:hypothetical protein ACNOYE_00065 [Nannocystaceae bacterium ST9]
MTRPLPERFHQLLPAIYRQRDVEQGEPLRALLAVLEQEFERVRANVETSFDNWFIETCERWLVPYIGALVGVEGGHVEAEQVGTRAFVANTIAYRRRRGTALMLEQLAQDITGYRVRAVEYFQRVQVTQHVQHVREPAALAFAGTVDLRDAGRLERFDGPFDRQAHKAEVRRAASARGRYDLPNLGLHLWRIDSFEITRSQAAAIPDSPNYFRFDPWGHDAPLYNVPRTETEISSLAEEVNLPLPLRRRELADDLARAIPIYLGGDPVFGVRLAVDGQLGPPLEPVICNLAGEPGSLAAIQPPPGKVAVDPELGRLVLNVDDLDVEGELEVMVDHAFGSAGPLGAGPWDRSDALARQLGDVTITWRHHVSRNQTLIAELGAATSLADAIAAWNSHVQTAGPGAVGMITLLGGRTDGVHPEIEPESRIWTAPSDPIQLPEGARLYLVAAGVDIPDGDAPTQAVARNTRAIVIGDLEVVGSGDAATTRPGGLWLDGIGLIGSLHVLAGQLEILDLAYCTIAAPGGITIAHALGNTNAALELGLDRTIVGPIAASSPITSITATDSLIGDGTAAIDLPGAALTITRSTVLGESACRTAEASDSIFTGSLSAEQHQQGCLRFCYVAPGGQIPRPFRCQPKLALEGVVDAQAQTAIRRRIQPHHVASSFGAPGFGLLHPEAPIELRTGAEDGSELGVFHHLQQARREARLRDALQRYLRFGLEAGLFIES